MVAVAMAFIGSMLGSSLETEEAAKTRSQNSSFYPTHSSNIYIGQKHGEYPTRARLVGPTCMSVRLGESDSYVSEIGCGTIAWGDKARGYDGTFNRRDVLAAAKYLAANGVNHFDCAEVYGRGNAEQLLSDALAQPGVPAGTVVSTKFFPLPWTAIVGVGGGVRLCRQSVRDALRNSLTRLGAARVGLYYIHFPFPLPGLVDGIADCVDAGLVQEVGVSNYNRRQLREVYSAFTSRGIKLACNQFRFNLLDRSAEKSGLIEETLALGLTPIGYEPLAQGLLTGKYTDNVNSPAGKYTLQQLKLFRQLTNLMRFVGTVGASGEPRTITEVALAYCVSKNLVAIPGIKNEGQAREAVRALNWAMSRDIVETLDEKSDYIVRQKSRP
jgi:aryl-alcohol dehydrogenase-like predicted oxidoreductase